jgi:hypothetical protein
MGIVDWKGCKMTEVINTQRHKILDNLARKMFFLNESNPTERDMQLAIVALCEAVKFILERTEI